MKILITLLLLFVTRLANADGGAIQFQGDSGPFHITLFTLPSILQAGPIDVTVLLQEKSTMEPLLDADIRFGLTLIREGTTQRDAWLPPACAWTPTSGLTDVPARLNHGENKLLYGTLIQVPRAGTWNLETNIKRGSERTTISTTLSINPPAPPALAYWRLFAIPPLGIAGFALYQKARGRRRR
jgi:hypothetical protein